MAEFDADFHGMTNIEVARDVAFIDTLKTFKDLEAAAQGNATLLAIERRVVVDFGRLNWCDEAVGVKYAEAVGFRCQCISLMTRVLNSYQTLLKQSGTTSFTFVEACTNALRVHKVIKSELEQNKPEAAFKRFDELSSVANSISQAAIELHHEMNALAMESDTVLMDIAQENATAVLMSDEAMQNMLRPCMTAIAEVKKTLRTHDILWQQVSWFADELVLSRGVKDLWENDEGFSDDVKLEWAISAAEWAALGSVNLKVWRAIDRKSGAAAMEVASLAGQLLKHDGEEL